MKSNHSRTLFAVAAGSVASLTLAATLLMPTVANAQDATPVTTTPAAYGNQYGGSTNHDAALAGALGITEDALDAAKVVAGEAAIDAAVAQGTLTAEQAALMKANGIEGRAYGPVRGADVDAEALLAQSLGISVEELQAAHSSLFAERLAAAVASGELTQEEADALSAGGGFGAGSTLWAQGDGPFAQLHSWGPGDGQQSGYGGAQAQQNGAGIGPMGNGGGQNGNGAMDGSCGAECVPQLDGTGNQFGGRGPRGSNG